jgi:predicted nuclease with TOPRIM domain
MEHNIIKGDGGLGDLDVHSMNGCQDFASVITTLEQRFDNLVADAQLYRSSSDKKEAQIQKLKKELHDVSIEKTTLQAGVQAKIMEVERLRSIKTKVVPAEDSISAQSEIEEFVRIHFDHIPCNLILCIISVTELKVV